MIQMLQSIFGEKTKGKIGHEELGNRVRNADLGDTKSQGIVVIWGNKFADDVGREKVVTRRVLLGGIPGEGDRDDSVKGIARDGEEILQAGENAIRIIGLDTAEEGDAVMVSKNRKVPGFEAAVRGEEVVTADVRIGETGSNVLNKLVESAALILGVSVLRDDAEGEEVVDIKAGVEMDEIAGLGIRASSDVVVRLVRISGIRVFGTINGEDMEGERIYVNGVFPVVLVDEPVEELLKEMERDLVTNLTEGRFRGNVQRVEKAGVDELSVNVSGLHAKHEAETGRDRELGVAAAREAMMR